MSDVFVVEAPIRMTQEMLQRAYPAQYLKTQQNRKAPVSKLPVEILLRIFISVRDAVDDPRRTLRRIIEVCREWRDIATTAPLLWTRYLSSSRPKWTTLALQRTQIAPLAPLEVDVDLHNGISDISKALLAHTSHTSKLKMTGRPTHLIAAQELMENETSLLKELIIFCTGPRPYSDTEDELIPVLKLSSTKFLHAHDLRHLELNTVDINFNSPLLHNLTTLSLHRVSPASLPTWSQLVDMLRRMPLLNHLTLEHVFPVFDPSASFLKPVYLLFLDTLSLECGTASQIQTILSHVFLLRPKDLSLKWHEDDVDYISTLRIIGEVIHAKIIGHGFSSLDVELAYGDRSLDFSASTTWRGPSIFVSVPNTARVSEPLVIANFIDLLSMEAIASLDLDISKEYDCEVLLCLAGKMPLLQTVTISLSMAFDFFEVMGMTHGISQTISFPRMEDFNFLNSNFLDREEWVENDAMDVLATRREHNAQLKSVHFHYVDDLSPEMVAKFEEQVEYVDVTSDT